MEINKIEFQIEKEVQEKANIIFEKLGITPEIAIKIFLSKVIINNGMPFELSANNKSENKTFERRREGNRDEGERSRGYERRDRSDRGDRGDRGDRRGRSDRSDRGDRGERGERTERSWSRNDDRGSFGANKFGRDRFSKDRGFGKEEFHLKGNLLNDSKRAFSKNFTRKDEDFKPRREKISIKNDE